MMSDQELNEFVGKKENSELVYAITMRLLLQKEIAEKKKELAKYEKIIADWKNNH